MPPTRNRYVYDHPLIPNRAQDCASTRQSNRVGGAPPTRSGRVSRLVTEMTAAGLVARESNPDDGRSAFVAITDAGRERLRAAAPGYLAGIERCFADKLDPDELHTLAATLGKILGPTDLAITPGGLHNTHVYIDCQSARIKHFGSQCNPRHIRTQLGITSETLTLHTGLYL
ncbi:MarR family winged helix-turn-helix transcriptional regulator [Nocardia sp. CA-135953]|uniref:MarR family winged helix-turn-helix transcriptional regulator n=1 Tax=Nocardia sp. CA-135953 TaxID=3239978 RepID=UPI003D980011